MALVVMIFTPIYTISSLILIFTHTSLISILLNVFLLSVEEIGLFFAIYLFYMISGAFMYHSEERKLSYDENFSPPVTIIIPSHGTDFDQIKNTLKGALEIDYPNYEIILSDNALDLKYVEKIKTYCIKKGINFFHKDDTRGFKAGNINAVLSESKGEIILILDSDHVPKKEILKNVVPHFRNENLSYVQARANFRNATGLGYRSANSIIYSMFFGVIQTAKSLRGVSLFNGSTGCFRKDFLIKLDPPGFSEITFIEDIDTSMKLLNKGYQGSYVDQVCSTGSVPTSAKEQVSQLWRWTHGACAILRIRLFEFLFTKKISIKDRLELILNTMVFFAGATTIVLNFILSLMIVFNVGLIRPIIFGITLGFVMPTLFLFAYGLSNLLAIVWEPREQHFLIRLIQLIPLNLFTVSAHFYLFSAILEGLFLKNGPSSKDSIWNKNLKTTRTSFIGLGFCLFFGIVGVYGILVNNVLWMMVLPMMITCLLAPVIILYEEIK